MKTHYASYLSGFPAGGSTLMSCKQTLGCRASSGQSLSQLLIREYFKFLTFFLTTDITPGSLTMSIAYFASPSNFLEPPAYL